jgi:hypothetical protein
LDIDKLVNIRVSTYIHFFLFNIEGYGEFFSGITPILSAKPEIVVPESDSGISFSKFPVSGHLF